MYFFFDTPHLLKWTRNNLQNKGVLKTEHRTVKWSHIKEVYELSHPLKGRPLPKIADCHINQSPFGNMKIKFTTQVFSDSISVAILTFVSLNLSETDVITTSTFCQKTDKLFNLLKSSTASPSKPRKFLFALSASSDPQTISKCKEPKDSLKSILSYISQ